MKWSVRGTISSARVSRLRTLAIVFWRWSAERLFIARHSGNRRRSTQVGDATMMAGVA